MSAFPPDVVKAVVTLWGGGSDIVTFRGPCGAAPPPGFHPVTEDITSVHLITFSVQNSGLDGLRRPSQTTWIKNVVWPMGLTSIHSAVGFRLIEAPHCCIQIILLVLCSLTDVCTLNWIINLLSFPFISWRFGAELLPSVGHCPRLHAVPLLLSTSAQCQPERLFSLRIHRISQVCMI